MKKLLIAGIVAFSLIGGIASAQSYSSCVSISTTLSVGSRGSQVLALQQFLVSQDYPGSGTWMETGYYGQATAAAVRDFQESRGLPQTGSVDLVTLSALQSCGNSYTSTTYPYTYTGAGYTTYPYTTNTTYPYTTSYPYNYGYNYGIAPTITSLSQNTGTPGESVTIYGQGFQSTNTVYFDNTPVSSISSSGTSLTFTIPYISAYAQNESVNLYVQNSGGTSNSLTFTLNPSTCGTYGCSTCTTYPYSYSYANCGCSNTYSYSSSCSTCGNVYSTYPYTSNCQGNTNSPTIISLSPQSGGVGTVVTVYGSGFTTSGNTIHFGSGVLTGYGSADGQSISFVVPSQLVGYGSQPVTLGSYNVSVTNSNNVTSNSIAFTVTSTNGSGTGSPTISSVSGPTSLSTDQEGTWSMIVNTQGSSYTTVSAYWGDTGNGYVDQAAPQVVSNTQTVTFSHAYSNPGTYTLTFTVSNSAGQSSSYTSTVYVSGNGSVGYGTPSISSITPTSGYVGSQVSIYGSNFSTSNLNTIEFGSGAIQDVYSSGNTITFTVPSYVTPYCAPGTACPQYAQEITPGTYNVSVMDQYGTSNEVSFTVL